MLVFLLVAKQRAQSCTADRRKLWHATARLARRKARKPWTTQPQPNLAGGFHRPGWGTSLASTGLTDRDQALVVMKHSSSHILPLAVFKILRFA